MLFLNHIGLTQFKNYRHQHFDFTEKIVGLHGKNGVGKTNLLDAIHYLCFTRSYFIRQDSQNAHHGKNGFRIEGDFTLAGKAEKTVCIVRETGRKEFSINDDSYDKFSRHIGHYPCVIIVPDDIHLITGISEERRKFLDALLSQLDPEYLQHLITYTRLLQQRNALLRSLAENNSPDHSLLDVLDDQIEPPGTFIHKTRKEFLFTFLPLVNQLYHSISGRTEAINILYESELGQAPFARLLQLNRQRDLLSQRTQSGIHRDDLEINLNDLLFRNIASQGQRKSLLFAMKLAEMDVLQTAKGFPPLLLLDDIFEKLDEERVGNLLRKVCVENEGQLFITDTNEHRLREQLSLLNKPFQLIGL